MQGTRGRCRIYWSQQIGRHPTIDTHDSHGCGRVGRPGHDRRKSDFPDRAEGKSSPYGVTTHKASVNVCTHHDNAEFALASIRRWRELIGQDQYPKAPVPHVTADGGSYGYRPRLFKADSQVFANETGLNISV